VSADSVDTLVEIGVMGRPHGVLGKIRIFLHNPSSTALRDAESIHISLDDQTRPYRVTSIQQGGKGLLVGLEGISNHDQAEALKGGRVCMRRSELSPTEPDEFYVADLIGLEGWDRETLLGTVSSSRPQGSIEVVTVEGETESVEIPLVEDYVVEIDIPNGRILFRDTEELPRTPVMRQERKGSQT
jgi:16S rRNA processing protein RimM